MYICIILYQMIRRNLQGSLTDRRILVILRVGLGFGLCVCMYRLSAHPFIRGIRAKSFKYLMFKSIRLNLILSILIG